MISPDPAMFLGAGATLRAALEAIDKGGYGIAFFGGRDTPLDGILTQYEVRKALLGGASLDDSSLEFANVRPLVLPTTASREEILEFIQTTGKSPIPLVDSNGRVQCLATVQSVFDADPALDRTAVIMAGGLGKRLGRLTADLPKPLLPLFGEKPVLQVIIEGLRRHGFRRILVAIRYKGELIEQFLGDGRGLGLEIHYIREKEPLGTAGALGLIDRKPDGPFLVVNGDLLTRVDFTAVFEHHARSPEKMTMCVRRHEAELPFGVVELKDDRVTAIAEKPIQSWLVNAGIYVLSPEVLNLIMPGERLDMTDLTDRVIAEWGGVGTFFVHEYWLDIGRPKDLNQASRDYEDHF